MTYDYHGTWDEETGLNSPLYARDSEPFNETHKSTQKDWKNANYSINYWINNGCPPEKLNFGLAAYGRSFTLKNTTLNKVGAPSVRGGHAGTYTKEEGIYSYYEVCEKLNVENWKKHWDDNQQSFYATYDDQWVSFDNQRSISLKVKWAYTMSLGGTMLWTLDFDDYTGQFCNEGPFPIANAIKSVFDEFNQPQSSSLVVANGKNNNNQSAKIDDELNQPNVTQANDEQTSSTSTQPTTTTSSSSSPNLSVFVGSGDIIFSNNINGISIGYDPSLGGAGNDNYNLPSANLTANISSSNDLDQTNVKQINSDLDDSNSAAKHSSPFSYLFFFVLLIVRI